MSIKPEYQKIPLKNSIFTKYSETHKVLIRPYEIEGRNKIYENNNFFEQQKELSKVLNELNKNDQIQGLINQHPKNFKIKEYWTF